MLLQSTSLGSRQCSLRPHRRIARLVRDGASLRRSTISDRSSSRARTGRRAPLPPTRATRSGATRSAGTAASRRRLQACNADDAGVPVFVCKTACGRRARPAGWHGSTSRKSTRTMPVLRSTRGHCRRGSICRRARASTGRCRSPPVHQGVQKARRACSQARRGRGGVNARVAAARSARPLERARTRSHTRLPRSGIGAPGVRTSAHREHATPPGAMGGQRPATPSRTVTSDDGRSRCHVPARRASSRALSSFRCLRRPSIAVYCEAAFVLRSAAAQHVKCRKFRQLTLQYMVHIVRTSPSSDRIISSDEARRRTTRMRHVIWQTGTTSRLIRNPRAGRRQARKTRQIVLPKGSRRGCPRETRSLRERRFRHHDLPAALTSG